jgi:hypothetical protein
MSASSSNIEAVDPMDVEDIMPPLVDDTIASAELILVSDEIERLGLSPMLSSMDGDVSQDTSVQIAEQLHRSSHQHVDEDADDEYAVQYTGGAAATIDAASQEAEYAADQAKNELEMQRYFNLKDSFRTYAHDPVIRLSLYNRLWPIEDALRFLRVHPDIVHDGENFLDVAYVVAKHFKAQAGIHGRRQLPPVPMANGSYVWIQ